MNELIRKGQNITWLSSWRLERLNGLINRSRERSEVQPTKQVFNDIFEKLKHQQKYN